MQENGRADFDREMEGLRRAETGLQFWLSINLLSRG
jgi:hypothetical protein